MAGARVVAAVILILLGASCGASQVSNPAAPTPHVNVTGTIDRSAAPACPTDEPCDPPIVAYRLVFSRPGQPDVSVRPGPTGSFALHLDPGGYTITAQPPPTRGRLEPSSVRVPADGTVELHLHISG